jgi:transposase
MYVDIVPNRNSRPTTLIRESRREGKIIHKRTIANISHWTEQKALTLRALLKGDVLVTQDELFSIEESLPHGHVEAVLGTIKKLKLDSIISSRRCRERDLVIAMIAERLIHPCSKLATTRTWHASTLPEELSVKDANEDDLYDAMDWLLSRQKKIENKLAQRHLSEGALVLYDISSSYYEGYTCPLARFGHNRDGKKGKPIIVYGVMTDNQGRPISVDVYPGNTGDPTTIPDQVVKLQDRFGLSSMVLVGDRGMLTQTQIETLKKHPGIGWISALRSHSIRELVERKHIQMSLFDKRNLAEIVCNEYPGERLIACFNPVLANERHHKRLALLASTEKDLKKLSKVVERRKKKPLSGSEIGIKVGKFFNRYKVGKHFNLKIKDGFFSWERNEISIQCEAELDGIYVIRTSETKRRMSSEDVVRNYKSLSLVERAFRCLKGVDLLVRPIYHRTEDRVRAHIFICMLAYYVEWHMRKALSPILFDDEELDTNRQKRDPVAAARPSHSAKKKKKFRVTNEGLTVHSFNTILIELGTRCRNRCKIKTLHDAKPFYKITELNPLQARAFQLLGLCPVQ